MSKAIKVNLRGIPESDHDEVLREIGDFVVDSILDRVGDGKSPVEGEKFKKLSKAYADAEKAGDRTPNLDLNGDMLDSLTFEITGENEVTVGIFDEEQAQKAFGHNTGFQGHSKLRSKDNKRRFIPRKSQNFNSNIRSGIKEILEEFRGSN